MLGYLHRQTEKEDDMLYSKEEFLRWIGGCLAMVLICGFVLIGGFLAGFVTVVPRASAPLTAAEQANLNIILPAAYAACGGELSRSSYITLGKYGPDGQLSCFATHKPVFSDD